MERARKVIKKRLAALLIGAAAMGAAVAGPVSTASAAPASDGGCDSATYEFCAYTGTGYTGSSIKVRWGQPDQWISLRNTALWHQISSVVNNTNYTWGLASDAGQVYLSVAPFHHLSSLGSADNKAEVLGLWH
ncbi:peptidase inhibitor family I36 [Streptomyces sp. TLI_55]|nr:peptidase inhibitor family I36 [Streptomyces sp. TLI_55]